VRCAGGPSGYYAWRDRPQSARQAADHNLEADIRRIHADNRAVYGSPRVHATLRAEGRRIGVNRVAQLMRHHGIQGRHKRRAPRTTDSNHAHSIAPNLLDRQFTAAAPNRVWLADITYVPTVEGWLYLAVVLDLFARRVVGWAMSETMPQELTIDALKMAIVQRRPGLGLLHHSDRGSPICRAYLSSPAARKRYALFHEPQRQLLGQRAHGKLPPLREDGACNAPRLQDQGPSTRHLFDYMEVFYNCQRRHSTINYVAPLAFEESTSA
jgi:putative transposase